MWVLQTFHAIPELDLPSLIIKQPLKWNVSTSTQLGSLWEAAIWEMKLLLRKLIAPHSLRYNELYTSCRSWSYPNCRPTTHIGSKITSNKRSQRHQISSLHRWTLFYHLTQDICNNWIKLCILSRYTSETNGTNKSRTSRKNISSLTRMNNSDTDIHEIWHKRNKITLQPLTLQLPNTHQDSPDHLSQTSEQATLLAQGYIFKSK